MRVRNVGVKTLAAFALVSVGLIGPGTVAAVDLGTFDLGDLVQMAKDCDTEPFAHVHVFDEFNVQIGAEIPIDPAIPSAFVLDTATYGGGSFTVTIHCEGPDHHDPTNITNTYTFVVNAPATTTTAVIPATGAASTSSMTLIAAFALLAGAGLLLVRRRSLG